MEVLGLGGSVDPIFPVRVKEYSLTHVFHVRVTFYCQVCVFDELLTVSVNCDECPVICTVIDWPCKAPMLCFTISHLSYSEIKSHRRSQDFVWGALFSSKSWRPVLKIDSCSAWGVLGLWDALTKFPWKLRLNFFTALRVQVHPLPPPGYAYRLSTFCHANLPCVDIGIIWRLAQTWPQCWANPWVLSGSVAWWIDILV